MILYPSPPQGGLFYAMSVYQAGKKQRFQSNAWLVFDTYAETNPLEQNYPLSFL
jgi:hypothetical protein